MIRHAPRSTRTYALCPDTTLFRAAVAAGTGRDERAVDPRPGWPCRPRDRPLPALSLPLPGPEPAGKAARRQLSDSGPRIFPQLFRAPRLPCGNGSHRRAGAFRDPSAGGPRAEGAGLARYALLLLRGLSPAGGG